MPFGLKSADPTYKRFINAVFVRKIRHNLEAYIDGLIVKILEGESHTTKLEDIFGSVRDYNMHLNPAKCSFSIQAEKFLDYMLTKWDIEDNPNKFQTIIYMIIPFNVKEIQQIIGRLVGLYRFLSHACDKFFLFFRHAEEE